MEKTEQFEEVGKKIPPPSHSINYGLYTKMVAEMKEGPHPVLAKSFAEAQGLMRAGYRKGWVMAKQRLGDTSEYHVWKVKQRVPTAAAKSKSKATAKRTVKKRPSKRKSR